VLLISAALVNLRHPRLPVPLALAIGVLTGSLLWVGLVYLTFVCIDPKPFLPRFNFILAEGRRMAMVWGIAATAWHFLNRSAARQASLRAVELTQRQLETGMLEARLQALQAQVEPHFLFNTLAHVKRFFRTDRVRARLMLDSFRAYLRSALPQMRSADVTLGREIDLVHAYLDVQHVRMGRRLRIQFDIPEALRKEAFPPMMLISLVENAIKHGLNPLPRGGVIQISASGRGGALEVSVIDTGGGIADQIGSGVGLSNIRARLAALFGRQGELSLKPNSPQGVCATIRIPRLPAAVGGVERGSIATLDPEAAASPLRDLRVHSR
jgi:sensor histidine kinase YesM